MPFGAVAIFTSAFNFWFALTYVCVCVCDYCDKTHTVMKQDLFLKNNIFLSSDVLKKVSEIGSIFVIRQNIGGHLLCWLR